MCDPRLSEAQKVDTQNLPPLSLPRCLLCPNSKDILLDKKKSHLQQKINTVWEPLFLNQDTGRGLTASAAAPSTPAAKERKQFVH